MIGERMATDGIKMEQKLFQSRIQKFAKFISLLFYQLLKMTKDSDAMLIFFLMLIINLLVIKNFSKNCEDVGMQKMYGNKVGMEETQEYNYPTSIA